MKKILAILIVIVASIAVAHAEVVIVDSDNINLTGSPGQIAFIDNNTKLGFNAGFSFDPDTGSLGTPQSATTPDFIKLREISGNGTEYKGWTVPSSLTDNTLLQIPDTDPSGTILKCGTPSAGISTCSWALKPFHQTYPMTNPTDADDGLIDHLASAMTITSVTCWAEGTTPSISVDLQECDSDGSSNCASVLSSPITCNGGKDAGTISDTSFAADHTFKMLVGTPSGTVSRIMLEIEGTQAW